MTVTPPPPAIRPLGPGDDPGLVRRLRLEMLADTPLAYIEHFDEAVRRPPAYWIDRLRRYTADPARVMFVAENGGRWVGQAGGHVDGSGVAHLVSVYVAPPHRASGLVERLSEAVFAWARGHGATEVRLEVARENARAVAAYRRLGFTETGRSQPHPLYPDRSVEIEMSRTL